MLRIFKNLFSQKKNNKLETLIEEGAFLVDVRNPDEFSLGHVKGSVNIPLGELPNRLAKFKDQNQIVVFCRSGMRSAQAKLILEQKGFTNVINGGTWQKINKIITK